jgi:hypothetical protein
MNFRAIASWGNFPSVIVTTKAPYAATWGLMSSLSPPAGFFNWLKSWYWWSKSYEP